MQPVPIIVMGCSVTIIPIPKSDIAIFLIIIMTVFTAPIPAMFGCIIIRLIFQIAAGIKYNIIVVKGSLLTRLRFPTWVLAVASWETIR